MFLLLPLLFPSSAFSPLPQGPELLLEREGSVSYFAPSNGLLFPDLDGDGLGEILVGSPTRAEGGFVHLLGSSSLLPIWIATKATPTAFGGGLALLPDLDGDAIPEVVVAEPGSSGDPSFRGALHLLSGASGQFLWSHAAASPLHGFGSSLAVTPDIDGDGVSDLLVGAPSTNQGLGPCGAAELLSGATGASLHSWLGSASVEQLGVAVGTVSDIDGDGVDEGMISAPRAGGSAMGEVQIISLPSGVVIRRLASGKNADRFGDALAGMQDLDGDGLPEIAVGAPYNDTGNNKRTGAVYVFSAATGIELFHAEGIQSYDELGVSVAAMDDVDGDGVQDLAVGAPYAGAQGEVELYSGATGTLIRTIQPSIVGGGFGIWLGVFGDQDGDGSLDLAVADSGKFELSVHSPTTGALLALLRASVQRLGLGWVLKPCDDLDGDGVSDLLASTLTDQGSNRVMALSGLDLASLFTVNGPSPDEFFGAALDSGPDFDGDGVSDFAIGNPGAFNSIPRKVGFFHLHAGSDGSELLRFEGFGGNFGEALAFLPDLDGDGVEELLVSAPRARNQAFIQAGLVYVISLPTRTILFESEGAVDGQRFGHALSPLGDLNLDGKADFLVSAPSEGSATLARPGEIQAISGADGSLLYTVQGTQDRDQFGESLVLCDDLDLDGFPEYAVGAPAADGGALSECGSVSLHSGANGATVWSMDGPASGAWFGYQVASTGDLDGDGISDLMAEAPYHSEVGLSGVGSVYVLSGATGSTLAHWNSTTGAAVWAGRGMAGLGDLDGDGQGEYVIGEREFGGGLDEGAGRLEVWSLPAVGPYLAPVDLVAGQAAELRVFGASGPLVGFGLSLTGPGPTFVPQLGLSLELSPPIQEIGRAAVNGAGQATLTGTIPASWLGRTIWMQAVDGGSGVPRATNPLVRIAR